MIGAVGAAAALAEPLNWFFDPFESGFMRRALLAVLIVGAFVPMVGVWIVLRRLAYLGDAMSHGLLSGVAAAYILEISVTAGAIAAGVVMALLISGLARNRRLRSDSSIGIAETILFSAGLVLLAANRGKVNVDLESFLIGQITTTTAHELRVNALLAGLGLVFMAMRFSDLRAASFDAVHASLVGVRTGWLELQLLVLLATAIVISLQTVGLLMSVALMVTPATTARLCTDRLVPTLALAAAFGVSSGVIGLVLAYHLSSPAGATIALVAAAFFLVVAAGRAIKTGSWRRHLHGAETVDHG